MLERRWENTFVFIRNVLKSIKKYSLVKTRRQNLCFKVKEKGKGLRNLNIMQNKTELLPQYIYRSSIFKINDCLIFQQINNELIEQDTHLKQRLSTWWIDPGWTPLIL